MGTQPKSEMVPLGLSSGRLAALTGQPPPGYGRVLKAALDGVLPARRIGGRWFIAEADLMAAAAVLGMVAGPAEPASPPEPGRPTGPKPAGEEGASAARRAAPKAQSRGGAGAHCRAGKKAVRGRDGAFPHRRVRRGGLA
jgi:hypothetical protein